MATYTGPADANGFKVRLTYTVTPKSDNSGWTINMYESLVATTSGKYFTSWTLTCYCGVSESSTLNATAHKQFSIPNLGTIDLTTAKNFTVTLAQAGGTSDAPTATIYGYCDADTNATYVPVNNSVSKVISLPPIITTPAPTAPTYLSASSNSSTGITLTWSGATGSITSYEVFYSTSSLSTPGTPQITGISSSDSSYIDTTATADQSRYYWIRAVGPGGTSSWYPGSSQGGSGGVMPTPYTVTFTNSYGSSGSSSKTVLSGNSTTFPDPGTRPGYKFNGWNNNTNYYAGANTPNITYNATYSADYGWVVLAPGFTDESVISQLYINQAIESTANYTVSATDTTSYSLQPSGNGLNPLSWLSINASNGALSGSTNVPGTYTFRVAATGITTTAYSNTITITVVYPGKRTNSTLGQAQFETARRWDGAQWIPLTLMKRWDGSGWVNLSN